jgi:hypothetical protein
VGALISVGREWWRWGGRRGSYVRWFWRNGYDELQDAEVSVLGTRLLGLTWIGIALIIVWMGSAWFGGYVHVR